MSLFPLISPTPFPLSYSSILLWLTDVLTWGICFEGYDVCGIYGKGHTDFY